MVLPSLPDRFDAVFRVQCLVLLGELSGSAVHHYVDLSAEILHGSGDFHACSFEILDLVGRYIQWIAQLDREFRLVCGPRLGHTDYLHIILLVDSCGDPFSDCSVSVDSDLYLHGKHLARVWIKGYYYCRMRPQSHTLVIGSEILLTGLV